MNPVGVRFRMRYTGIKGNGCLVYEVQAGNCNTPGKHQPSAGAYCLFFLPCENIIEYTRIVGILLASVILAHVVKEVFVKDIHGGIVFILIGGIILVLGQVFNLAIAIFEPGIQGARLLYVEFFSKFYRGNGRQFRPFGSRRKYTLPDEPED